MWFVWLMCLMKALTYHSLSACYFFAQQCQREYFYNNLVVD